jgi:nicotinamidase-related amidase
MLNKKYFFTIVFLLIGSTFNSTYARRISLDCQTRNAITGEVIVKSTVLETSKTAIVIVDMWNFHWCMTASERVAAMTPRMNSVVDVARKLGMTIVWNPSDVVTAYSGYPQYEKAVGVKQLTAPHIREDIKVKFTAPIGKCMCGHGIHCHGNYGWDAMNPDLKIDERDLISSSNDELYSILSERGVTDLIYMGVHTNMCVFGKPGAMSNMWKSGFRCMLARDLNDAMTTYDPDKGYTPDTGTTEINDNLQRAGIPNVNMGDEFRKAGLMNPIIPVDYVRFAPWGKHNRPYFFEHSTIVTLTATWLDDTEIRYTIDGTKPNTKSQLYTVPLKISETTDIRAAAFSKGKQVSLESTAFYVKMPDMPPKPDVYLDDLDYITNAYLKSVSMCLWYPQRQKSFEEKRLRIRGVVYDRGMGFRAPSSVQYAIKPEYKRFVALAGVDDNMLAQNNARFIGMHNSVVFCVHIDGIKVAESPVMRLSQEPWRFDIPIPEGSRLINIACMDAGTRNILDYGNWVDCGFVIDKNEER